MAGCVWSSLGQGPDRTSSMCFPQVGWGAVWLFSGQGPCAPCCQGAHAVPYGHITLAPESGGADVVLGAEGEQDWKDPAWTRDFYLLSRCQEPHCQRISTWNTLSAERPSLTWARTWDFSLCCLFETRLQTEEEVPLTHNGPSQEQPCVRVWIWLESVPHMCI